MLPATPTNILALSAPFSEFIVYLAPYRLSFFGVRFILFVVFECSRIRCDGNFVRTCKGKRFRRVFLKLKEVGDSKACTKGTRMWQ